MFLLIGYQTITKVIDNKHFYKIEIEKGVIIDKEVEVVGQVNSTIISTLDPINSQTLTSCELEKIS